MIANYIKAKLSFKFLLKLIYNVNEVKNDWEISRYKFRSQIKFINQSF